MNWLILAETYILPDRRSSSWVDIVLPLVLVLLFIPTVIWLVRRLRAAAAQTSAVISINIELIQITKEQMEVSRETNRLLSELNETLRKKADGP